MRHINEVASWFNKNNILRIDEETDNLRLNLLCLYTKVAYNIKGLELVCNTPTINGKQIDIGITDTNVETNFTDEEMRIINTINREYGYLKTKALLYYITDLKGELTFAAVIGFVIFGMNNGQFVGDYAVGFVPSNVDNEVSRYTFNTFSPGFGMFIASISIFYAFDGFYVAAGIKSELKEPKKTPSIILVGLVVTTIIYLVVAVSMSLGSNGGNPQGLVQ